MRMDVSQLVRTLRGIDPLAYGPATIGTLMRDVRIGLGEVEPFMSVRKGGYTRNLVYADAHFELMVLVWDQDATTAIHDHAGQHCWFTALSGTFDLQNYRRVSGGRAPGAARIAPAETLRGVSIGEPDYRHGDSDIHRVAVAPGCEQAISLHVYANPLATCLVFDEERGVCGLKQLKYDTVAVDRLAAINP